MSDPNFGSSLNQNLAPFVDVNGNADYDPLTGDYPDILGHQAIWWIMNDAGGPKILDGTNIEPAIGLELQVMAFAFATNDHINNMTFYNYTLINKGNNILDSTYIGQWVDPDLGYFGDDFVGCDVGRGLGICYNGDNFDEFTLGGYGANPPVIAIKFCKGPLADPNDSIDNDRDGVIDEAGEQIMMSNFMNYWGDIKPQVDHPQIAPDFYNYLRSLWLDGSNMTYDGMAGLNQSFPPCKFKFPGTSDLTIGWGLGGTPVNPVGPPTNFEWSELTFGNTPAERKFIMSAGPFTMQPGAVNELTIDVIWVRASDSIAVFDSLMAADDLAQQLCDSNFILTDFPDIHQLDLTNSISIFPNPVKKSFKILLESGNEHIESFVLYDINGKIVKKRKGLITNHIDINRNDLKSGIYFYRIFLNNDNVYSGKLIFQ